MKQITVTTYSKLNLVTFNQLSINGNSSFRWRTTTIQRGQPSHHAKIIHRLSSVLIIFLISGGAAAWCSWLRDCDCKVVKNIWGRSLAEEKEHVLRMRSSLDNLIPMARCNTAGGWFHSQIALRNCFLNSKSRRIFFSKLFQDYPNPFSHANVHQSIPWKIHLALTSIWTTCC